MANYADLFVDQGTDFNYQIVMHDSTNNSNLDISGYTFSGQVRRSIYSANVTANLTITLVDGANGVFNISMTAANTANIEDNRYMYDIKYDTGSEVVRALQGQMFVSGAVTR